MIFFLQLVLINSQIWNEQGLKYRVCTQIDIKSKSNNLKANQNLKVLYFISPFIIWISYCLLGYIIDRLGFTGDTREWAHFAAGLFIPSFFALVLWPFQSVFLQKQCFQNLDYRGFNLVLFTASLLHLVELTSQKPSF